MRHCEIIHNVPTSDSYPWTVTVSVHPSMWSQFAKLVHLSPDEFQMLTNLQPEPDGWVAYVVPPKQHATALNKRGVALIEKSGAFPGELVLNELSPHFPARFPAQIARINGVKSRRACSRSTGRDAQAYGPDVAPLAGRGSHPDAASIKWLVGRQLIPIRNRQPQSCARVRGVSHRSRRLLAESLRAMLRRSRRSSEHGLHGGDDGHARRCSMPGAASDGQREAYQSRWRIE